MLALEVLMDHGPVRIRMTTMPGLLARPSEQDLLERGVGLLRRHTLRHPRRRQAPQRQTNRRGRHPNPDADLARRHARLM